MARGPAPVPTALKVLRGSRIRNRREPRAAAGRPALPADLGPLERAAWWETVRQLEVVPNLLTRADRGVLELVARTLPLWRDAAAHVREHGSTVVARDDKGAIRFVQVSPQMQVVVKLGGALKALYAELGLTPAGRSRLQATPAAAPSALESFLGGGRRGA